jgi:(4-O-methyl)-D-glucuronate---lignin esterase
MRLLFAAALCVCAAACTPLGLSTASTNFQKEETAHPAVLGAFEGDAPVTTADQWTTRRVPLLKKAFEREIYGPVPQELHATAVTTRVVDQNFAKGEGVLEEIDVRIGEGADAPRFRIAIAYPKGASPDHKVPLILNENFCGNAGTFDSTGLSDGGCMNEGTMASVIRLIFGKYIITGPNAQILTRGYAYATLYAGPFADDNPEIAKAQLEALGKLLPEGRKPTGVVAVWAAAFGWALDVLEKDPRIDPSRTAIWGHSRQGKAALLAAAFDPRIEAVIPLQSGKGGATLTRAYAGESVKQITKSYPHWFAPTYVAYADHEANLPLDQHQLIAMVAPRPVMLGNGWKDVWSDPNGAFRAALGADPVYKLFGKKGLTQTGLKDTATPGELEWFIRPGGHGVRVTDWDEMLAFCDRWIGPTK